VSQVGSQGVPRLRARRIALAFAAALLAVLGALAASRLYVGDLARRLVREANAIVAAPRPRPVHVDAVLPGSLGDALAQDLPPFEAAWKEAARDGAARAMLGAVVAGNRPLRELPATYVELLHRLGPHLDGLLRGTHAERADLAPSAMPFMPAPGVTWASYQLAASLLAVRIRQELEERRAGDAVRDCLDGFALARDAAIAGGLIGRTVGTSVTEKMEPVCAEAIPAPAAPATLDRRGAVQRLRRIRDAVPSIAATLREEALQAQLMMEGWLLTRQELDQLQGRPRAMAREAVRPASLWRRVLDRMTWRRTRWMYDALLPMAALEPVARDRAFQAYAHRLATSWDPTARRLSGNPTVLAGYARRFDAATARIDLVVLLSAASLFHEAHHAWPKSVQDLAAGQLLSADEAHRLEGARLEAAGEALDVAVPLPLAVNDLTELRGAVRAR
jgi:hypothetical protein